VDPDYVLESAPSTVKGQYLSRRTVLAHLSPDDYDLLAAARNKKSIQPGDIARVEGVVDRILKCNP
jgi:hypothetical protein